jgi:hypothetical protein
LIVVIDAFAANTHAVHHRNPAASIIGWIAVLFLIAVPSFFAGIRFIREALDDPRRHRT